MPCDIETPFPYKAVIFDMDGVIVDTEGYYVAEEREFAREVLGVNLTDEELFGIVGTSHSEFRERLVRWFGRAGMSLTADDAEERFDEWSAHRVCDYVALLNPGVADTLRGLHAFGVRTALASSSPLDNIYEVLSECGLSDMFEVIVSGEQFHQSKPNPAIYFHTLSMLGLSADECCCIEDSVPGIAAGKAAGLTVFAKREDRFGFSQDEADGIIDEIPDLISAVRRYR